MKALFILMLTSFRFSLRSSFQHVSPTIVKSNSNMNVKFKGSLSEQNEIIKLSQKYSWYAVTIGQKTNYMADALNPQDFDSVILEVRLIPNATARDGVPSSYLSNVNQTIIEVVRSINNMIEPSYYAIDSENTEAIISLSNPIDEESEIFNRLITSYNAYFSWNSFSQPSPNEHTIHNGQRKIRANSTHPAINEQAPLDYYLKTKEIKKNSPIFNKFSYSETGGESNLNLSSAITSLLPKSYFTMTGTHSECGSEWGYYINTSKDNGDNYFSQVLIFDVIQIWATVEFADQVTIKVVEHSNYKYDEKSQSVYYDSVNHLCLGNPSLESSIEYVQCTDNRNNKRHPNPSDSDYDYNSDDGFSFGEEKIMHIGQGKASDKKIKGDKALFNFSKDLAISLIPGLNASPIGSFILSQSLSFISDHLFDKIFPTTDGDHTLTKGNDGKYIYSYDNPNSFTNIEARRDFCELRKSSYFRMPPYSNANKTNNEIKNNRQTPLLFKDETDSINFWHTVISSQTSSDYTAVVAHHISLDIFNDDSIAIFKFDPTFLTNIQGTWGYLYGVDISPAKKEISSTNQSVHVAFGSKHSQDIDFTPLVTSDYDLILTDATPESKFYIEGFSSAAGVENSDGFTSVFIPTISSAKLKINYSFKVNIHLIKGKTYHIHVRRLITKQYFGFGKFAIYEAHNGLGSLQEKPLTGSSTGKISQMVEYKGLQQTYHFYSKEDQIVTIALSASKDTYLTLLDDKYRPFINDDDSFGGRNAGLIIRVKAFSPIFVSPRLYSQSSSDKISRTISNSLWIPSFQNNHNYPTPVMNIKVDCSKAQDYYYYVSFNEDCEFTLYNKYWSEYAYVYIYDSQFNEIKNSRMDDDTMLVINVKSNEVFAIRVSVYNIDKKSYFASILVQ